jgi:hypothetical protein
VQGANCGENMKINSILSESVNLKVFCDLDGVLVNFDKGVKDITGQYPKEIPEEELREKLRINCLSGTNFWEHLDWQPGGKAIWEAIEPFNPIILTGIHRGELGDICAEGKRKWCANHLGSNVEVITTFSKDKKNWASENCVLIDDRKNNIRLWKKNGGIGIRVRDPEIALQEIQTLLRIS